MAPFTRDRLQRGETPSLDELLAGRDTQAAAILRAGGLLAFGLGPDDTPPDAPADNTRPLRLFEKIVRRHALKPGCVRTDLRFIHEYYTGMCAHLLAQRFGAGYRLHEPQQIVCFEDHLSYVERSPVHVAQNLVGGARRLSQAHREFVALHGLVDHGFLADGEGSQGISHAMVAERCALPGQLIVGWAGKPASSSPTPRPCVEAVLDAWMCSDPGAAYAEHIHVDAAALSPMVARPMCASIASARAGSPHLRRSARRGCNRRAVRAQTVAPAHRPRPSR